jgi:hypothetical protein
MDDAKQALDILRLVRPIVEKTISKKKMSSSDISMLLLYDMAARMGTMEGGFNQLAKEFHELRNEFGELRKNIEPLAQLAREEILDRREARIRRGENG